jgi:release factor glutamine methyltransferase
MPAETMPFGPLTVAFDATVLRPRPWTAAQGRWAAELLAGPDAPAGAMLELCCGAGQIGLVAAVLSGRTLVQVDASDTACRFATANAAAAGVADRISVRCAPVDRALLDDERFAVVLADPPYIPTAEVSGFPEDPVMAIDGGEDGLRLLDLCLRTAARHVAPGGHVLVQVRGEEQAGAAAALTSALSVVEMRTFGPERALLRLVMAGSPAPA